MRTDLVLNGKISHRKMPIFGRNHVVVEPCLWRSAFISKSSHRISIFVFYFGYLGSVCNLRIRIRENPCQKYIMLVFTTVAPLADCYCLSFSSPSKLVCFLRLPQLQSSSPLHTGRSFDGIIHSLNGGLK